MILNPKECKALVLARKPNVKLSLFAEGVALPLVDVVDLFGLTLDDSLKTVCLFYSASVRPFRAFPPGGEGGTPV